MIYWRLSGFIQKPTSFPSGAVRRFMKNINRVRRDVRILFHSRRPRSRSKQRRRVIHLFPRCFHYANNNKAKLSGIARRFEGRACKVHRARAATPCRALIRGESFSRHVSPSEWAGSGMGRGREGDGGGGGLYGSCSSGMHRRTFDPWMSGIIKISGDINPTCGSSCQKYPGIKSLAI